MCFFCFTYNYPHRDEGETLKDPSDDSSTSLSAFVKAPTKIVIPQEEIVESPKSTPVAERPRVHPKKKLRKDNANKGIEIIENPPAPSLDDVIFADFSYLSKFHESVGECASTWTWPPDVLGFEMNLPT
jgi:hypothetical protein